MFAGYRWNQSTPATSGPIRKESNHQHGNSVALARITHAEEPETPLTIAQLRLKPRPVSVAIEPGMFPESRRITPQKMR